MSDGRARRAEPRECGSPHVDIAGWWSIESSTVPWRKPRPVSPCLLIDDGLSEEFDPAPRPDESRRAMIPSPLEECRVAMAGSRLTMLIRARAEEEA